MRGVRRNALLKKKIRQTQTPQSLFKTVPAPPRAAFSPLPSRSRPISLLACGLSVSPRWLTRHAAAPGTGAGSGNRPGDALRACPSKQAFPFGTHAHTQSYVFTHAANEYMHTHTRRMRHLQKHWPSFTGTFRRALSYC